mmetsp:Transcript_37894/g.81815  ORF Transcript_37894/g.81815 Transcript_37894/m.81815 type:complete len:178 (+) Transcript_37894:112-645(+)
MNCKSSRYTTLNRHHGTILAYLCLLQLLSLTRSPASAIGGWEPIHILFSRLNNERSQSEQQHQLSASSSSSSSHVSGRKTAEERIAPVPSGGGDSSSYSQGKEEEGGGSSKKRHVGEVTMTSTMTTTSSSSSSSDSNHVADEETVPAFVPRGRRGGIQLDENDLRTITFVGNSNPFL